MGNTSSARDNATLGNSTPRATELQLPIAMSGQRPSEGASEQDHALASRVASESHIEKLGDPQGTGEGRVGTSTSPYQVVYNELSENGTFDSQRLNGPSTCATEGRPILTMGPHMASFQSVFEGLVGRESYFIQAATGLGPSLHFSARCVGAAETPPWAPNYPLAFTPAVVVRNTRRGGKPYPGASIAYQTADVFTLAPIQLTGKFICHPRRNSAQTARLLRSAGLRCSHVCESSKACGGYCSCQPQKWGAIGAKAQDSNARTATCGPQGSSLTTVLMRDPEVTVPGATRDSNPPFLSQKDTQDEEEGEHESIPLPTRCMMSFPKMCDVWVSVAQPERASGEASTNAPVQRLPLSTWPVPLPLASLGGVMQTTGGPVACSAAARQLENRLNQVLHTLSAFWEGEAEARAWVGLVIRGCYRYDAMPLPELVASAVNGESGANQKPVSCFKSRRNATKPSMTGTDDVTWVETEETLRALYDKIDPQRRCVDGLAFSGLMQLKIRLAGLLPSQKVAQALETPELGGDATSAVPLTSGDGASAAPEVWEPGNPRRCVASESSMAASINSSLLSANDRDRKTPPILLEWRLEEAYGPSCHELERLLMERSFKGTRVTTGEQLISAIQRESRLPLCQWLFLPRSDLEAFEPGHSGAFESCDRVEGAFFPTTQSCRALQSLATLYHGGQNQHIFWEDLTHLPTLRKALLELVLTRGLQFSYVGHSKSSLPLLVQGLSIAMSWTTMTQELRAVSVSSSRNRLQEVLATLETVYPVQSVPTLEDVVAAFCSAAEEMYIQPTEKILSSKGLEAIFDEVNWASGFNSHGPVLSVMALVTRLLEFPNIPQPAISRSQEISGYPEVPDVLSYEKCFLRSRLHLSRLMALTFSNTEWLLALDSPNNGTSSASPEALQVLVNQFAQRWVIPWLFPEKDGQITIQEVARALWDQCEQLAGCLPVTDVLRGAVSIEAIRYNRLQMVDGPAEKLHGAKALFNEVTSICPLAGATQATILQFLLSKRLACDTLSEAIQTTEAKIYLVRLELNLRFLQRLLENRQARDELLFELYPHLVSSSPVNGKNQQSYIGKFFTRLVGNDYLGSSSTGFCRPRVEFMNFVEVAESHYTEECVSSAHDTHLRASPSLGDASRLQRNPWESDSSRDTGIDGVTENATVDAVEWFKKFCWGFTCRDLSWNEGCEWVSADALWTTIIQSGSSLSTEHVMDIVKDEIYHSASTHGFRSLSLVAVVPCFLVYPYLFNHEIGNQQNAIRRARQLHRAILRQHSVDPTKNR